MPFSFKAAKADFKLKLDGETPTAPVEPIGGGWYITACPLCGCAHEVLARRAVDGTIWQPTCITPPLARVYQPIISKWEKQHPECAGFTAVRLALVKPAVIIPFAGLLQDTPAAADRIAA